MCTANANEMKSKGFHLLIWFDCVGRDKRPGREVGDLEGEESPGQGEDEGLREDSSSERTGEKQEWSHSLDNWLLSDEFIGWMVINC